MFRRSRQLKYDVILHLTWFVFLHYLAKLETQKFHLFTQISCVALQTAHKTYQFHYEIIDRLSFIHKTVNWVHQTWSRLDRKTSSHVICTRSAFTTSAVMYGTMSVMEVFFLLCAKYSCQKSKSNDTYSSYNEKCLGFFYETRCTLLWSL